MGRVGVSAFAAVAVLAVTPGHARADVGVLALDSGDKLVDVTRSNASIERTPPEPAPAPADKLAVTDPDALRFLLSGKASEAPTTVSIVSFDPAGGRLDALEGVTLTKTPCLYGAGPVCWTTSYIRAVADDVDRNHPLVAGRSVRAEVGGTLAVYSGATKLRSVRVGGPRATPVGAIPRLRGRLRIVMVRHRPGGGPPFGVEDDAARALAERQLAWTNALWGQCGITFGPVAEADIRIVDPPPPHLLALGCDMGLPASGGELRVRVEGRPVRVELKPRMTPRVAARVVARAIEAAGFVARVSENSRIEPGADRTADVLVRRRDGQLATLEMPSDGRLSSDPSMTACIGEVDLSDGLDHFTDVDAPAGTVEERALIKAFDDGDPGTIEIFMIPAFAGGGRIGESFINADRSSVRNVVIEDRAGIRADRASFALAHELGHILLDMPGHPDDYGVDVPTLLMDSDAADPSAFGPRRLTLEDCARAYRESGPGSQTSLLVPWPLGEESTARAPARPPVISR
jgi:hypothetical protein